MADLLDRLQGHEIILIQLEVSGREGLLEMGNAELDDRVALTVEDAVGVLYLAETGFDPAVLGRTDRKITFSYPRSGR